MPWSHTWHPSGALLGLAGDTHVLLAGEQHPGCSPEHTHISIPLWQPLEHTAQLSPAVFRNYNLLWRGRLQKEPLAQQMATNKRIAVTRCTFHCSASLTFCTRASPWGNETLVFSSITFSPLSVLSSRGLKYVRMCWTLLQLKNPIPLACIWLT